MPTVDHIDESALQPIRCTDLSRLGSPHDGGYVVSVRALRRASTLVSLGLSVDWNFPAPSFEIPTKPYCVLHLGAGSPLRYWEPGKWIELIAYLEDSDIQPVLSTGPGEAHLVENVDPKSVLPCFPGSLSLPQVFRLLSESSAVVCPDTGIAHLARLVGVPTIVLFGPGSTTMFGGGEFWRNAPSRNVTIANFPCRNQNIIFRRNLPWSQHCARTTKQCAAPKCMEALTYSMVRDAFESMRNELGF